MWMFFYKTLTISVQNWKKIKKSNIEGFEGKHKTSKYLQANLDKFLKFRIYNPQITSFVNVHELFLIFQVFEKL